MSAIIEARGLVNKYGEGADPIDHGCQVADRTFRHDHSSTRSYWNPKC